MRYGIVNLITTRLFSSLKLNSTGLSCALQSYIDSNAHLEGQTLHAFIVKAGFKPDIYLSTKLLILYVKSNNLKYARQMFDKIHEPTIESWNAMISCYSRNGPAEKTLNFISQMANSGLKFDGFTYASILRVSALIHDLGLGKQVHTQITKNGFQSDEVLYTALIDMYSKSDSISCARKVFSEMPERNVVSCTAMIHGYMRCACPNEAHEIFDGIHEKDVVAWNALIEGYSSHPNYALKSLTAYVEMQRSGFRPTVSTFSSIIGACIILSALEQGQMIHAQVIKSDSRHDVRSNSALIDMYAKCGEILESRRVFDKMPHKNIVSWTAIIDGYGKHGDTNEALRLYEKMLKFGIQPNHVTFLSMLSACGHTGLTQEGWQVFMSMREEYGLEPKVEHYACMVDILGRAGLLDEALCFIRKMPVEPNDDVWGALLGACGIHGNVEMASLAAEELFKLNAARPGSYVGLSNTFAAAGRWEGVSKVRELMREKGVSKDAGCSWVEREA
ncbi:hypothetical protein AMTRI_Chr08g202170 [Amborella trichopoda]|uniref:pentatricopeptide repeat-containing protein At1g28690, mitochondrial n=1 Tax=Amborella trichopoda TaxID=13333 RepID=UPI0009BD5CA4|nr:pentatricopeptide repeat-containing protein At1g28690, mitochondrial [Amborella trichopoda]|eukprot:XP_020525329.1 pentatricopeptide repeat-containing protein At1g28690, mitochondrial [Amborella trichopoda]